MKKNTCDLIIENTAILNEKYDVQEKKSIAIKDGHILTVADASELKKRYESDVVLHGTGKLFMPGLTDGHMHTGQQLLRGKILDELPMIWTRIMLPFESTLTAEKMKLSAQLAALEMMTSGTTSFVDAGSYYMEEAAEVYAESGLRGALSYSTMDDVTLPEAIRMNALEAIERTDSLYEAYHGKGNLKVYYSLRSLISCSEKLIWLAAERAKEKNTRLQAHMNEYPNEVNFFLQKYQERPLEFLSREGILSHRFMSAHSLLISEEEMEVLKEYHVDVVHCPFSNCGKAIPNTPALLKRGITVGLGTDGTAHGGMSMFQEMKIFRSIMNAEYGTKLAKPDIMPAKQILKMVLEGGASLMDEAGALGVLKKGYKADLISIDLMQPHLYPTNNLTNTLLESVHAGDVRDMIVGGKIIMKDKEVLTLDQERIFHEVRNLCLK